MTGQTYSFYLPDDLMIKLANMANKDKRSISNYLTLIIEEHLQKQGKKK